MKFSNLLLSGALLMAASQVYAEITPRVKPVPAKSPLEMGKTMYLYNSGAKGFFLGANDWGTRASFADNGFKVRITQHLDENGAAVDGVVALKDSVESKKEWLNTWFAADGAMWVDLASQADTLFTLTNLGDNVYRLGSSQLNPANKPDSEGTQFVGAKTDGSDTKLYWNLTTDDGYVDWYFVSEDDYAKYLAEDSIYNAAENLRALMTTVTADGMNVDKYVAIYNDLTKTKAELEAAYAELKAEYSVFVEQNTKADAPKEMTSLITNPSFDNNKKDGWSGTDPGFQSYTDAEFYQKTYDFYQKLSGGPKGVYALTVKAFYRAGFSDASYTNFLNNAEQNAKLYAIAGTDTVQSNVKNAFAGAITTAKGMNESNVTDADGNTLYIPNNMETAEAYFNDGDAYLNTLFFATDDGTMRVGLKSDRSISGDWTLFDDFGLKYYGNGADAYTKWLEDVKSQVNDYTTMPEGTLLTQGMAEEFKSLVAGLTASDKAGVLDAIKKIKDGEAAIKENMAAWQAYKTVYDKCNVTVNDDEISGEDKDALGDQMMDEEEFLANLTATTEEVKAETEKLTKMNDDAIKNGLSAGTDVTDKFITNANFETTTGANTGWIVKKANGGNVAYGGPTENRCFEAWNNSDFDVYQEVKDAPVGVYTITVQGFYRYLRDNNAYQAYNDGTAANYKDVVKVYVNDNTGSFPSVFDEKVANGELYKADASPAPYVDPDGTYWYPNDMVNAGLAFSKGMYTATSFGVVAKKGDVLRLGVKGNSSQQGDSWAIWDNFKMTFQGTNVDVVKPLLESEITKLQTALESTEPTGKSTKALANEALATAQSAVSGTDGKTMFSALCGAIAASDTLAKSRALFAELKTQNDNLSSVRATSTAKQSVLDEASELFAEIDEAINNGSINDDEVAEYEKQIATLIVKLGIPAEADNASDTNPVDMTSCIKTPSFEKDGANSVDGWTTSGYNFGNDDTQKGALLLEYYNKNFDLAQTLNGLPAGTYEVKVHAFYRYGTSSEDFKHFKAGENNPNAMMYAVMGTDSVSKPVALLSSDASTDESRGISGTTSVTDEDGTVYYVPNDMVTANAFFTENENGGSGNEYVNSLIVKLEEGQPLTIGLKKTGTNYGSDWFICDNWTLTYYGANSTKTPTTGIDNIADNSRAFTVTEVYTIDGRRVNRLQKGLNIVKVKDANGKISFRKMMVR